MAAATIAGLPPPSILLGHPKFTEWYPGQEQAFRDLMMWLQAPERFLCMNAPTGSGKSLLAMLLAVLGSKKVAVLTVTKGLQAQLNGDYKQIGLEDIRGQNNYECIDADTVSFVSVEDGHCHAGIPCDFRKSGCLYYDRVEVAKRSPLIVTNYSYYLAQMHFSDGLGHRDLLICDEAHLAFQALESHLSLFFGNAEIQSLGADPPLGFKVWEEWLAWGRDVIKPARAALLLVEEEIAEILGEGGKPSAGLTRSIKHYKYIVGRLERLIGAKGRWIWQAIRSGWQLTPVWPGQQASVLYGTIPKILLMSATLNPKTADSLAVPESDRRWLDVPSYFPAKQSPIAHYKTIRMNNKTTDGEMRVWAAHIDQLISRRLDRKGIVFTVSYNRRNFLLNNSEYRHLMMTHASDNVYQVVEEFKQAPAPRILLSPTVTSGWDFPDTACEYAIIGKIPYPDSRDPVVKARLEDDKDWTSYLAMTTLEQEVGRGTRSATDRCEYLIVDDNWAWFRKRYGQFASRWFHDRVITKPFDLVPGPLV